MSSRRSQTRSRRCGRQILRKFVTSEAPKPPAVARHTEAEERVEAGASLDVLAISMIILCIPGSPGPGRGPEARQAAGGD